MDRYLKEHGNRCADSDIKNRFSKINWAGSQYPTRKLKSTHKAPTLIFM